MQFLILASNFNIIMYLFDAALNFHQPFLQSSVSHDLSEIILICWFIISVETGS